MAPDDRTAFTFTERLTIPWWSWPLILAVAAGLAFEIGLGVPGVITWLPFLLLIPGTVFGLFWAGRIRIRVTADRFHVDDAHLPVAFIESVEPLTKTALRDAMSVQLHPLAFVIQRPWIHSAVRVVLNDPDDPTPYWIVSTRRPEELCRALRALGATPDQPVSHQ